MADLLDQAEGSLADARVLARRRSPNVRLLLDLALRQALSVISLAEGLDVSDRLSLDVLLRRVPALHPQAELVRSLNEPDGRDAATVARLIDALRRPPKCRAKPAAKAEPAPAAPARDEPLPRADAELDRGRAFDASPRGNLVEHDGGATSAAFWTLMDRWRTGDLEALSLIGHAGGLTAKGTRPRFRLRGQEAAHYAGLRRIDGAMELLSLSPDWLRTRQAGQPLDGDTPLAAIAADPGRGIAAVLGLLQRQGLRKGLAS